MSGKTILVYREMPLASEFPWIKLALFRRAIPTSLAHNRLLLRSITVRSTVFFFLMGRWTFKTPFGASLTTLVMTRVEVGEEPQYGKTQPKGCAPSGAPMATEWLAV